MPSTVWQPLTNVSLVTAGTAVPLSASQLFVTGVIIQYPYSAKGFVSIGDSAVTNGQGRTLAPGEEAIFESNIVKGQMIDFNLADLYAVSTQASQSLSILVRVRGA
jgi:hypothetical protein